MRGKRCWYEMTLPHYCSSDCLENGSVNITSPESILSSQGASLSVNVGLEKGFKCETIATYFNLLDEEVEKILVFIHNSCKNLMYKDY